MHWNFLIWFWACRRREVQPVQKPSALRTNAPLSTDGKIFLFPAPHGPSPPPPIFKRECLFVYCYNWFIAAAGWPFTVALGNAECGQICLQLCLPLPTFTDTRSSLRAETATHLWYEPIRARAALSVRACEFVFLTLNIHTCGNFVWCFILRLNRFC